MNQHVFGAERRSEPSPGETQAPEFDAMTWGAEQALKAMIEYQVESLRFLARRTYCNLEFLRHLRHCAGWQDMAQVQPGSRSASATMARNWPALPEQASSSPEATSRRCKG